MATEPVYHTMSRAMSADVAEGPSFKTSIIQRRYAPALIDMAETPQTDIERTPEFFLQSKYSHRIGSVLFRLIFLTKYSRWFLAWYRGNGQMAASSKETGIRDTFMKVLLFCFYTDLRIFLITKCFLGFSLGYITHSARH